VPVKDGISKTKQLFNQLEEGVPIFEFSGEKTRNEDKAIAKTFREECKQIGKKSYSQLLTGVSYMLPFVVAGGILIAISFF
jgi:PTS system fructose-specific IIC component